MAMKDRIDKHLRGAVGIAAPFVVGDKGFIEAGMDGVFYVHVDAVATLAPGQSNYHADLASLGIDSERFAK